MMAYVEIYSDESLLKKYVNVIKRSWSLYESLL